jgi:hypothetical protein
MYWLKENRNKKHSVAIDGNLKIVVRYSALHAGRTVPPKKISGNNFC